MIVEIVRCDRCGDAITGNSKIQRYTTEYLRFDLCIPCNNLLHDWLIARNTDERPDETEGDDPQYPDVKGVDWQK